MEIGQDCLTSSLLPNPYSVWFQKLRDPNDGPNWVNWVTVPSPGCSCTSLQDFLLQLASVGRLQSFKVLRPLQKLCAELHTMCSSTGLGKLCQYCCVAYPPGHLGPNQHHLWQAQAGRSLADLFCSRPCASYLHDLVPCLQTPWVQGEISRDRLFKTDVEWRCQRVGLVGQDAGM